MRILSPAHLDSSQLRLLVNPAVFYHVYFYLHMLLLFTLCWTSDTTLKFYIKEALFNILLFIP